MIIHKLLLLESEAQEAMRTLEKEQAIMTRKAEEEISHHLAELENEKQVAFQNLAQDIQDETQAIIAKIQAEYEQKRGELVSAFTASRSAWTEKVVQDVLHKTQ